MELHSIYPWKFYEFPNGTTGKLAFPVRFRERRMSLQKS